MSAQTPSGAPPDPDQRRDAKAELAAAQARVKAERPWYKKKRFIGGGVIALLVIASIAGGSSDSTDNSSDPDIAAPPPAAEPQDAAPAPPPPPPPAEPACTNKATDDCTPEVASNRSVRVDALTWSVLDATTSKTIGDQEYGLGEKADDVFLMVTIKVKSNKDESATLTDDNIKLVGSNGNTYSADSEGTIAVIGSGEESLFFEDIGPDQSHTSKVVFDVPQSVLDSGAKLRFNELGFGETHGFIRLPQ